MSTRTSTIEHARTSTGLARLEKMIKEAFALEGGWPMSRHQMDSLFGEEGIFAQRGIFGIKRFQNMLQTPVLTEAVDLAGFGMCSFKRMLHGQMLAYVQRFFANEDEAGFDALCRTENRLSQIDPNHLRGQCLVGAYPASSSVEKKFCLFPIKELRWENGILVAVRSDLAPNLPADTEVPNLGHVMAYIKRQLGRNEVLPRYIFLQHPLLPGSAHRAETSFQILIQPYEAKQITLIESPFPTSDLQGGDGGIYLRKHVLRRICDILHVDRAQFDYDSLRFHDDIMMWTGVMTSRDVFNNQGTGRSLELPD